jgi:hypothetical protein
MIARYARTFSVLLVIILCGAFALSDLRLDTWHALYGMFEWMETTLFGYIGQTWGAAFAVVEAFHLLGLALLGGSVLLADGRLLNLWFKDQPALLIEHQSRRVFNAGLVLLLATGIFMACGVAIKIYYLPVFWYKMLALATGIAFVFGIRRPLLAGDLDTLNPWTLKMVAIASLMVWFTVAACGRWIGFSG